MDEARLVTLEKDVGDMKSLMSKMVDALTRMALIEERQQAMAQTNHRILEQIQDIRDHQAAVDLASARNSVSPDRVAAIELSIREDHLEHERNKARLEAVSWTIKTIWVAGAAVASAVVWVVTKVPHLQ